MVHDGQILTTRSYGYAKTGADGEEPRLVDADALFRVGSVSKLPTSIAVMQLVEQGKLNLDADISTYVDVNIQRRFPGDITLRNLLTHTAGFEEHVGIATQDSELESYILQDPPTQIYAPGTTPAYSNYGMSLAGYIVQQVSGERFEDYIRDHVFAPAGMDSSTYEQPLPAHLTDRMANGYQSNGSTAHPFEIMADSPDGAMTTSGADAGRFMLALLGQSTGQLRVGRQGSQGVGQGLRVVGGNEQAGGRIGDDLGQALDPGGHQRPGRVHRLDGCVPEGLSPGGHDDGVGGLQHRPGGVHVTQQLDVTLQVLLTGALTQLGLVPLVAGEDRAAHA